jgi:hypothetical protein
VALVASSRSVTFPRTSSQVLSVTTTLLCIDAQTMQKLNS